MPNGIFVIDKPSDWTSHDVVAKLRGILREKRIGHGGTLDPMATGMLPIFVGQATRAVEFSENAPKEYVATLRLGTVTDTQDITGTVTSTHEVSATLHDLQAILPQFTGVISQIPPMYSAIKIQGKKLYELARKGKEVDRPARQITIYELELLEQVSPTDYRLRVVCSKGTYIRTLAHDMGQVLGCGATLTALRRTQAAGFTQADAVTLEQVQAQGADLLLPTEYFFKTHPSYTIPSTKQEARCRNGNTVLAPELADGTYRIYGQDGTFLAFSRCENGVLTSIKNFFGA
ncbi:tRNA pseudouridine(55) synthase TruB [Bengtsoniella intestinalis]|uniref:tRNA pseudouridine(55) synthase TruB n=1 Tax=Bengtsoniella intestinalis TaxID=3073143 RepID=UPI00391F5D8E